jgi:hypothetical protein
MPGARIRTQRCYKNFLLAPAFPVSSVDANGESAGAPFFFLFFSAFGFFFSRLLLN